MDSLDLRPTGDGWIEEACSRIRYRWFTKMAGTVIIMTLFFVGYFWLLNHARVTVTTVPRIFIDRMIPFWPGALLLYISLWIYVPLAPALMDDSRDFAPYCAAVIALSLVGFAIFLAWPTAVPRPEIDWSRHPSFSYLKAVDASGNAFPSLHVAFAVFTAIWMGRLLAEMSAGGLARALNWAWCAGIVYSTMAVRQHVALDAMAGAALGAAFGAAFVRARGALRARRAGGPPP
jgi:membrane-associated phospholipid phosphatase